LYPTLTVGGGYKALFRKIGNQASRYYPPPGADSEKPFSLVRRDTSFIYEAGRDVQLLNPLDP
jgi:inositol hexakisphosphate/diphosphoinositol-pentakisphosphate kinase